MDNFDKRKYIRYPAEVNEFVTISYLDESSSKTGQRIGLNQNESFNGCCAVFVGELNFKQGQEVFWESSSLPKVKAKVSWIKKLEDQIYKVGFNIIG
ncbi:MAG TPA: hypothetical protein PLV50_08365 [Smithella sp.]|nr:hypothetical protein [Smithella sp.]MDM7987208.1 hypothetical protein [Smithella sp.]HNY49797.1 hypothetical protein [Smithella sp.]HOG90537.1 hypothetical protein [Smithella sp.]HOU50742.1 hypothetical protein [Smithella sp.]